MASLEVRRVLREKGESRFNVLEPVEPPEHNDHNMMKSKDTDVDNLIMHRKTQSMKNISSSRPKSYIQICLQNTNCKKKNLRGKFRVNHYQKENIS